MIWATVSSWSCFCWLYRASPPLATKNIINLISVLAIWWCPCVESSLVLLKEGVCYDWCVAMQPLVPNKTTVLMRPGSVAQSCPTLCDPHGLWSTRFLCPWTSPGKNTEVVAISFSRGSSDSLSEPTCLASPTLAGGFLHHCATWEAQLFYYSLNFTFGSLMCIWTGFSQVPKDTIKFFLQKDFRIIIFQAALVSQKTLWHISSHYEYKNLRW